MNKLLLIVDPQYDFINGTLPVDKAEEKMNALCEYIKKHNDYKTVVITADWHPEKHCSFKENGGEWPKHCVAYTHGAAIYEPIIQTLRELNIDYKVLTKGNLEYQEEYSIFLNDDSYEWLGRKVSIEDIEQIDICGIAGDVCVHDTLIGGIMEFGEEKFNILMDYCPCIDDDFLLKSLNVKKTYGKD